MKKSKKLFIGLLAGTMLLGNIMTASAASAVKCPYCSNSGEWVAASYTATCNKCGDEIAYYTCKTAGHSFMTNHRH